MKKDVKGLVHRGMERLPYSEGVAGIVKAIREQSGLFAYYAKAAADADKLKKISALDLAKIEASLKQKFKRKNPRDSNMIIEAKVFDSDKYYEARISEIDAEYDSAVLKILRDSFEVRGKMLELEVKLLLSEFFADRNIESMKKGKVSRTLQKQFDGEAMKRLVKKEQAERRANSVTKKKGGSSK